MALSEKRLEVGVSADRKDNRGGLRISDETTVLVDYWFREKLTPEQVFAVPALQTSPAAADKSLISMDGLFLLGFGPRSFSLCPRLLTLRRSRGSCVAACAICLR